jgi:hypothetical protein
MKEPELLNHLIDLARRLGYEVRTEPGPFRDGFCRWREEQTAASDRQLIVLNRASQPHNKIAALTRVLGQCRLDDVFLLPAVRHAIESAQSQPSSHESFQEDSESSDNGESNVQPSSPPEATCLNHPLNP